MFGRRAEVRVLLSDVIDKFREKGATSPDSVMTIQKLRLSSKFDDLLKRPKGRLGIFVEVDGKYYSPMERLKEAREQRSKQRFRRW